MINDPQKLQKFFKPCECIQLLGAGVGDLHFLNEVSCQITSVLWPWTALPFSPPMMELSTQLALGDVGARFVLHPVLAKAKLLHAWQLLGESPEKFS